jgi:hypothetical protein
MRPPLRAGLAALLSFAIYAMPLVGPHAAVSLGGALFHGLTRREQSAAWIAAEIAVALALQASAGAISYWILGNLWSLRPLVLLLTLPSFFAFAQWCYLIALPTRFLIESDVRNEQRSWRVECTVPRTRTGRVHAPPPSCCAFRPTCFADVDRGAPRSTRA